MSAVLRIDTGMAEARLIVAKSPGNRDCDKNSIEKPSFDNFEVTFDCKNYNSAY
jgi:hypothetical protein